LKNSHCGRFPLTSRVPELVYSRFRHIFLTQQVSSLLCLGSLGLIHQRYQLCIDSHRRIMSSPRYPVYAVHYGQPGAHPRAMVSRGSSPGSPDGITPEDREPLAQPKSRPVTPELLYSNVVAAVPAPAKEFGVQIHSEAPSEVLLPTRAPILDVENDVVDEGYRKTAHTYVPRSLSTNSFGQSDSVPTAIDNLSHEQLVALARRYQYLASQALLSAEQRAPESSESETPQIAPQKSNVDKLVSNGAHLSIKTRPVAQPAIGKFSRVIQNESTQPHSARASRAARNNLVSTGPSARRLVVSSPPLPEAGKVSGQTTSERIANLTEEISRLKQEIEIKNSNHTKRVRPSEAKHAVKDGIVNQIHKDTSDRKPTYLPTSAASARMAAGSPVAKAIRDASLITAPSTPDPSDSSSSSSSESESNGMSEDENRQKRLHSNPALNRNRSMRSLSSSTRVEKMILKPIPPTKYNGSPDAFLYHRFVREGSTYVQMGRVPAHQQIFFLSYHLEGKAADFYNRKVVKNEDEWILQDFFWGLFNYCFPLDYRIQQRDRLNNCYQNEKPVVEHIAELEELYNMIGIVDNQEKVVTLWRSLSGDIQREMYRSKLDPEISTWDEVSDAAEHAEIILGLGSKNSGERDFHSRETEFDEGSNSDQQGRNGPSSGGREIRDDNVSTSSPNEPLSHNSEWESESTQQGSEPYENRSYDDYLEDWSPKQLSPEKRAQLIAARLCFICEEPGHIARVCPTWEEEDPDNEFYEEEYDGDEEVYEGDW
ncbi:hypothetical protein B0H11DRAFT_2331061, partial [Mycena galericulata]